MDHILLHNKQWKCFNKLAIPAWSGRPTRKRHLGWSWLIPCWVRTFLRFGPFPEFQWEYGNMEKNRAVLSLYLQVSEVNTHTDDSNWMLAGQPLWPDLLTLLGVEAKFWTPHRLDIPLGTWCSPTLRVLFTLLYGEVFWYITEAILYQRENIIWLEMIYFYFRKNKTTNSVVL